MAALRTFVWEGRDSSGRHAGGELNCASIRVARARLGVEGIRVLRIKRKGRRLPLRRRGVSSQELALFTRQLATLIRAGVPLLQSLEAVARSNERPVFSRILLDLRDQVEKGNAFAAALQRHPRQFDPLFCNLVRTGEQSGTLEVMLERLALHKEKTEALRAKLVAALRYPVFILLLAGVVCTLLLVRVVPQFESIFASFGAELPLLTARVIRLSGFLQNWWPMLASGGCLAVAGYRSALWRSRRLRDLQDALLLKLPVLGGICTGSAVARFARTLATTLGGGLPLLEALNSAGDATGNQVFRRATERVRDQVESGTQLHQAMHLAGVFPGMVVQLVAIGEESGSLDEMLDKAADYHEEAVDRAVESLTSLIEPVTMAVLGVSLGSLIIAMYLPVFSMGNVIGGTGQL